jgi:DNA polymerase-3 subunit gamma/tau
MDRQCEELGHRAPLARFLRRAAFVAAVGAGLWLAGQASASADELTPPAAVETTSPAVGGVSVDGLLSPVTSAVRTATETTQAPVAGVVPKPAPVVERVAQPVAEVAAPVARTAAPVVERVAAPVAEVAAPVAELAAPVVRAAEPVLKIAAPLEDAVAPVVDAVEEAVPPVVEVSEPPVRVREPLVSLTDDVVVPVLRGGSVLDEQPLSWGFARVTDAVQGSPDDGSRPGHVLSQARADDSTAAGPKGAPGDPAPVPPLTPVTGGSAGARSAGAHSYDQAAADLAPVVSVMTTAALTAADFARDAAANVASDPSFSPD